MKFAFELCQRVTVPHTSGKVQGQIVVAACSVDSENIYGVRALTDEGKVGQVDYSESTLLAAQPKATAPKR